ncbi:hypothetical protein P4646_23340 [Peribacillus simplex]|uniref:hypothetical protein n=1 Tax=Peribacillus simplex TaxID=1478 RepID=UPI002E1C3A29|nr:hypothetical protein [Peribacillus simplex]MED4094235.1 hypothetical protein [Peribacillus simplex]
MAHIDMKYLGTYYYANILQGIIKNSFDYLTNFKSIFGNYGILGFVQPFRKKSNLHEFIEFVIDSLFREESSNLTVTACRDTSNFNFGNPTYITPLEQAFRVYEMKHLSFIDWWKNSKHEILKNEQFGE